MARRRLTPRGAALRWLSAHRGTTENPPGSNRGGTITQAQQKLGSWLVGLPWCGVWACNAAMAGGVRPSKPYRWASVAAIEYDAKAHTNGFRGWISRPARAGKSWKNVYRGDLVVMFGPGVHVETIRDCSWRYRALGLVVTEGGNTSPEGGTGSQSNGGGAFKRKRRIADIHGIALVNFPG